MTTKKAKTTFDCVAMKREIQAKIQAEIAGMSWEEEKAYYRRSAEKARLAGVVAIGRGEEERDLRSVHSQEVEVPSRPCVSPAETTSVRDQHPGAQGFPKPASAAPSISAACAST